MHNRLQTYHICRTNYVHLFHTHYINMPYTTHMHISHICDILYIKHIPYMLHIQIYNVALTGIQHMPCIYAHTIHMQIYISIILHNYHTDYRTQTYYMHYIPQIHLTHHTCLYHTNPVCSHAHINEYIHVHAHNYSHWFKKLSDTYSSVRMWAIDSL